MGQILILSEAVANQIAAGEVVQQPSSAVKELMENAIDAGATQIDVSIKDAGKNLIQISDDGKGMSAEDAKICFERHATSKLRQANDLQNIRTMGFRGEALASIAAIAQVELVTKQADDELGTKVIISGSTIESVEPVTAAKGTRFSVRNLFFNVPARRKFMGSNAKQLQAIRNEFIQIALAHPQLKLSLSHNGEILYQLKSSNLRQRIVSLFGENINKNIFPIDVHTDVIHISGFVGSPEAAHKRSSEQYFFVNGRYIRHPYFRKAVMSVYEPLTAAGMQAVYFLFFEVDPESIDVNISPTKTEVKFEHEQIIWPILQAAVRESLGKFNATPSLDFDKENAPDIDVFKENRGPVAPPTVSYNPLYNPFHTKTSFQENRESSEKGCGDLRHEIHSHNENMGNLYRPKALVPQNWEALYKNFEDESALPLNEEQEALQTLFSSEDCLEEIGGQLQQLFGRYVLLPMGDQLLLIDQRRAHVRILFEQYSKQLDNGLSCSQTLLFPESLPVTPEREAEMENISDLLRCLGFVFEKEGENYLLSAVPDHSQGLNPIQLFNDMLDASMDSVPNFSNELKDKLALRLAISTAMPYGQSLHQSEMKALCRQLFQCALQKYTPDGKRILLHISASEIIKRFV